MAHGYFLATGRPQAVMVHVNVGLANTVMGVINAARDNVPLLLLSGRTPAGEGGRTGSRDLPIHWGQEMRDQGAMVREVVKWDYELRLPEQVPELIDRALAIAMSPPMGPVYLSLPREVLCSAMDGLILPEMPRQRADRHDGAGGGRARRGGGPDRRGRAAADADPARRRVRRRASTRWPTSPNVSRCRSSSSGRRASRCRSTIRCTPASIPRPPWPRPISCWRSMR